MQLQTSCYSLELYIRNDPVIDEFTPSATGGIWNDVNVKLSLHDAFSAKLHAENNTFMGRKDFERLAQYIEDSIKNIRSNTHANFDIYSPLNLGFEVRCIDGDLFDNNEGEITLETFIDISRENSADREHIGARGTVSFEQALTFADSLRV
ncbi:MAG: hypothetical protein ABIK07_25700 [Planctomycetota bacterium]